MASQSVEEVHPYLGALEAVDRPRHADLPDGTVVTLPLIYLPDIVLFPGDELPLRMLSDSDLGGEQLSRDGALLARFSVEEQRATVTGAARQRFRLKRRARSQRGGQALWGVVEILPQARAAGLPFNRLSCCRDGREEESSDQLKQQLEKKKRSLRRLRERQYPAYWGLSTYALYDAHVLVRKIQNMLLSNIHGDWFRKPSTVTPGDVGGEDDGASLVHYLAQPSERQDPNLFANWVAGNLPLDTSQRLELLQMDSTVRLLRREIELLEQVEDDIFCAMCGCFLANTREIFSMTARGAAGGTFVNPGGHVFQVLTLRDVDRAHIFVDIMRSTEDSWFLGYSWSITHCNVCYAHLGWRFDRVDATRSPACFFGFRRAALTRSRPQDQPQESGNDSEDDYDMQSVHSNESSEANSDERPLLLTEG
ncbi:hypothetical protein BBJ28_00018233 [Nothophytophthora sp. Chile5]|nr:hypothetical protein BBJ28_00018233 [Nothophytophthora sp. Chile5]